MKHDIQSSNLARRALALCLCELMVILSVSTNGAQSPSISTERSEPLRAYLQRSYLELFELAPTLHFTKEEIRKQHERLAKGEESCVNRFKSHVNRYQKQLDAARSDLKKNTTK